MPRAKKAAKKSTEPEQVNVTRRKQCPECMSKNIAFDNELEQVICGDCGNMFEELPGMEDSDDDMDYF